NGELILLVYKLPVPSPWGMLLFSVKVHCEMAFRPILLSRAEVTHQSISAFSQNDIHSSAPLKPPIKLGLKIRYCGFIVWSNFILSSNSATPISSSSKAIGNGVLRQSSAIASHCPCLIGCSIE